MKSEQTFQPRQFIPIGRIVGVFGIKGQVKVECLTDFLERFAPRSTVYLDGEPYKINTTSMHKTQIRLAFRGVSSIEEAEELIGKVIEVPADQRPELQPDEFYAGDLIGMKVITDQGKEVGVVDTINHAPAQDLLCVGKIMIPVVRQFVKSIDLDSRTIVITPIPGLLGDD